MTRFARLLLLLSLASNLEAKDADIIIKNARIIDGAGNPWYRGEIAIRDKRIAEIGNLSPGTTAPIVIDAAERYVTPGFIDVHTHCEGDFAKNPEAESFVRMGVTTVVTGNCGSSYADLAKAFTSHTQLGIGINMASLVGQGTVRREVMGNRNRDPVTTEIEAMKEIVAQAMRDGAVGMSTGLIYTPGTYTKTYELVALAGEVAKYGGLYATHMRSEGGEIEKAINEALEIGRTNHMPVEISHFKITSPKRFGLSTMTLQMVEEARKAGQDVTVDQYVYTASSTGINTMLPDWAVEGTTTDVQNRVKDPQQRAKIVESIIKSRRDEGGRPSLAYAFVSNFKADKSINGMNIVEIAKKWRNSDTWEAQAETVADIVTSGGASMVFHSMDEGDVRNIAAYPWTMFASDSGIREMGQGVPHPRGYGNNARVLARYVRDTGLLRLEDAIRKMSSLPAQRFRFFDRGVLRPGAAADLVVFDLAKVQDDSTFEKPHAFSRGFDYVMVNGDLVIDDGKLTGKRPGQILHGPGWTGANTASSTAVDHGAKGVVPSKANERTGTKSGRKRVSTTRGTGDGGRGSGGDRVGADRRDGRQPRRSPDAAKGPYPTWDAPEENRYLRPF
ncbi:MAG: D-aminoacylase [Candidatus Sumerlaeaceae bacterium]|nr:D-aminoacylase [Candidatus Sumerlaeaceae bacterium]